MSPQNLLTDIDETYFVDAASKSELMVMRKEMKRIAFDQNVRNSKKEILYESLVPSLVSASECLRNSLTYSLIY